MVPAQVDWQAQIHNQENRYTHLLEPQMNSENNYRLKSYGSIHCMWHVVQLKHLEIPPAKSRVGLIEGLLVSYRNMHVFIVSDCSSISLDK